MEDEMTRRVALLPFCALMIAVTWISFAEALLAIDDHEALAARANGYYSALEKRDFSKVWDYLGARTREQHRSREEYARELADFYGNVKVLARPSVSGLIWKDTGSGIAAKKLPGFAIPLEVQTKYSAHVLRVNHTTYWNNEQVPNSNGREDWYLVFEDTTADPKMFPAAQPAPPR